MLFLKKILFFQLISFLLGNFYLNNHSLNERYQVFDQTRELSSNIIVDLQSIYNLSNKIFMGTGEGLGLISINSDTVLVDMVINDNLPIGGNPCLRTFDFDNNFTVISGVEQILSDNGFITPAGTGISWSFDSLNWFHIEQPIDYSNQFEWYDQIINHQSITSTLNNVSYDIAVDSSQNYIYAASWAGMLRRFNYFEESPNWEIVPIPMDNQISLICEDIHEEYFYDPIIYDNHKLFGVYINDNTIWAGTANGVNRE